MTRRLVLAVLVALAAAAPALADWNQGNCTVVDKQPDAP